MNRHPDQRIAIIAAMSENHVIGRENKLPWSLPDDHRNFREVTRGKAFLMGRKSYESDDALLSDYRNVVISRKEELDLCAHCELANSIDEGLDLLREEPEFFILGGGGIFHQTLDRANYLYLTIVHHTFEGDAFFPELNWSQWQLVKHQLHPVDEQHAYSFSLNEYQRVPHEH